jgi:NAD(P)-dependent dehydrogenase (short-subunit alcohol dehydrogenase family)
MADPSEFQGKRVLVTGGTRGIDQAIVQRFRSSGATVLTTARSPSASRRRRAWAGRRREGAEPPKPMPRRRPPLRASRDQVE